MGRSYLKITREKLPKILVKSPFRFQHGGGERYTLGIAIALAQIADVTLSFDFQYSKLRLRRLAEDFDLVKQLESSSIHFIPSRNLVLDEFDLSIQVGNSIYPDPRFMVGKNIHHCQFPFPQPMIRRFLEQTRKSKKANNYVANSDFSRQHIEKELRSQSINSSCTTIEPFISSPSEQKISLGEGNTRIVSVGRFSNRGHAKRQDLLLEAMSQLRNKDEVEMNLVGGVSSVEDMEFLQSLRASAQALGLSVSFWPNATKRQLTALLNSSHIYWHGTGLGIDSPFSQPWSLEHFGIAPLEAMGSGLATFAFHIGGPAEYIEHAKTGFLFTDTKDLATMTDKYIDSSPTDKTNIIRSGQSRASENSFEKFSKSWQSLVANVLKGNKVQK